MCAASTMSGEMPRTVGIACAYDELPCFQPAARCVAKHGSDRRVTYTARMTDSPPRAFLPNFCAIRMVFAVVVSAELLAIVLTLGAFPPADQFWTELSLRSLYIQWITLSVAALYCGLRVPLSRLSHAWAGILAWLLILLTTAGVFGAAQLLALRAGRQVMPALAQHLAIAGIVGAVLLRYLYEQHRERQRELAESQARLQALQARIRPHFLFNTLNSIASLIGTRPDTAEKVASPPYDVLNSDEARAMAADNPHSFLHVVKAEIDLDPADAAEAVADGALRMRTRITVPIDEMILAADSAGIIDETYDYWVLGQGAQSHEPRWSIIRDVLGWVD